MPHTTTRTNRAHRIAYLVDIQRIIYAVTFGAFVHSWALLVISVLIPSAHTALMFLAALHRAGRYGYIGVAVAYDLMAPQVVKATGRKCSPRTLQRGLSFLKRFGLVELRPWTMPDQTITSGDRVIKLKGTGRVDLGNDRWCTRQIRIVVLTERAIALWDRATGSQGDRYLPQYPTYANLAPNSPIDQCVNTHMIESKSAERVKSTCPPKSVSDFEPTKDLSSKGSPANGSQGKPTSLGSSGASPQTVKQQVSTPVEQVKSQGPKSASSRALNEPCFSGEIDPKSQALGCSRLRPKIPRGAPNKRSWSVARKYILRELHTAIDRFSTRQADSIYDRAKFELSTNYPAGWPTSCDWPYWIGHFPEFSPSQRRFHMMRDILPLLKNPAPITPHEPARYREDQNEVSRPGSGAPEQKTGSIPEFLKKFADKFCVDD